MGPPTPHSPTSHGNSPLIASQDGQNFQPSIPFQAQTSLPGQNIFPTGNMPVQSRVSLPQSSAHPPWQYQGPAPFPYQAMGYQSGPVYTTSTAVSYPGQPIPQPTNSVIQSLPAMPPLISYSALPAPAAPPMGRRLYRSSVEGPNLTAEDETQYCLLRMALNNLLDPEESQQYKYHILLDHLKIDSAKRLALAFAYSSTPYSEAIKALDERYGQPRQLVTKELRAIMDMPAIRPGDTRALDSFALRVQTLVGLLQTMKEQGQAELLCGSHVDNLLEKLPTYLYSSF